MYNAYRRSLSSKAHNTLPVSKKCFYLDNLRIMQDTSFIKIFGYSRYSTAFGLTGLTVWIIDTIYTGLIRSCFAL